MKTHFLVLLSVFTSWNVLCLTQQKNNCWDGSFAYKVSSINIYDDKVEIAAKGAFDFYRQIDHDLDDDSGLALENGRSHHLLLAFDAKDCSEDISGEVSCYTSTDKPYDPLRTSFLVKRTINHLGEYEEIYTPVPVSGLLAKWSPTHFYAEIYQHTYDDEVLLQDLKAKIDFNTHICDENGWEGGTFFGALYFPEEVKEYIWKNR